MLVTSDGRIFGTIGGGCGEAEIFERALELLEAAGGCEIREVDLTEDPDSDSGKVCGGRFEVLLEVLDPESADAREYVADQLEEAGRRWLVALGADFAPSWKRKPGAPPPEQLFVPGRRWSRPELAPDFLRPWLTASQLDGEHFVEQGHRFFLEPRIARPELLVVGAGHIALPLAEMARVAGFSVTVYDDRPEYAEASRFDPSIAVECGAFERVFDERSPGPHSSLVLVTRGHRHDQECLRRAVGLPFGYVGMIGSWRRTRAVIEELKQEGLDGAWLDRVFAPIGLDIGARNPQEIAVSILAEIIALRCQGRESTLSLRNVVPKRRSVHV